MLTAHLDVVPVANQNWTLDPFLGKIVSHPETGKQVIWGRGAIDNKAGVLVSFLPIFCQITGLLAF